LEAALLPAAELTQVVFVHDYLQLVFDGERFSVYNRAALKVSGQILPQGAPGFADALVRLIGRRALDAQTEPSLVLQFEGGVSFAVESSGVGPEAWQYDGNGGEIVVAQNAA
jgi:hypothetical protein